MVPAQYWLTVGFLLFGGIFAVLGAWKDWAFFFEHRKARLIVGLIGRKGARVFYGVLGLLLAAGGAVMLLLGGALLQAP